MRQTLRLIPGADVYKTPTLNEAAISSCNLIRAVPDRSGIGLVQKLGGWEKYYGPVGYVTRNLLAWEDTNTLTYLAMGIDGPDTGGLLEVLSMGSLRDITPQSDTTNPGLGGGNYGVTTTAGSSNVIIFDPNSVIDSYDSVMVATPISVGGIVIFGLYKCTFSGSGQYAITAIDKLGFPQAAASSVTEGGAVPVFDTTSGSVTVTVTLNNHGYAIGDTFPIIVKTIAGGIYLYGNYIVSGVPSANTFTFNAQNSASSTATVSMNNGNARYIYLNGIGPVSTFSGYGVGGYGVGGYGNGQSSTASLSLPVRADDWSLDNWGQVLISNPEAADLIRTTTGASGSGSLARITYGGKSLIYIGTLISISGMVPAGYNGDYFATGYATTAASGAAGVATVTFSGGATIAVGSVIQINDVVPIDFNGIHVVTASSAGSVSFASAAVGPQTTAGKIASNEAVIFASATTGAQTVAGVIDDNEYHPEPIYQWDPTSGNPVAVAIPQGPPFSSGFFLAMPQRQIVAWGTTFAGIPDPLLVRWCDIGNYAVWIGNPANQAGSYRIPKGSRIVQGIQGPQQGLIWTDLSLWVMQYSGQPFVYQFNEIGTGCGCIGHRAAGSMNGIVYWMGQSQFFKLSGNGVEPMPCAVWDVIFQDLDRDNTSKIRVAPNSRFGEISWYYPSQSGGTGEVDKYVKYNVLLDVWDFGSLPRSAWINESVLGPPIGADPISTNIFQHEKGYDADGSPMLSSMQTGYFELDEADWMIFVDQIWPDMKWAFYGQPNAAQVLMTFYVADYADGPVRTYGPFAMSSDIEYLTPRLRGRLVSIKIESVDVGTFWRLGAIKYRMSRDGKF